MMTGPASATLARVRIPWLPRLVALTGIVLLHASAAPSQARQTVAGDPIATSSEQAYVIGPGDVLEVAVWENTEISRTVPVRPDGKISLPLLQDVQAAGLTPAELRDHLNEALARYIRAPAVCVIVREVHSFTVSVIGQVKAPGRFTLTGPATVLDVLALAGGLTEFADRSAIVILRRERTTTRRIPFAYDRVASGKVSNGEEHCFVQPNDVIVVR